ncbi:MAG: Mut7-C RNAse domain-containing protein [Methanomassiliicoccales archaeon]|nr:MAG: Mut7-C RNAse domain-containing protein [Methanomassiliicoccales archaeon]
MRFCADHMLGSLARWLRFLGFDTAYPEVLSDKELINLAESEKRVILTRDKELAKKRNIEALYIESTDLEEQLIQVIVGFNLKITDAFSRCSICNSILVPVKKALVKGKVPEKVYAWQNEYWECQKCQKYYWQGTHFQGIKAKLEELKGKTSAT